MKGINAIGEVLSRPVTWPDVARFFVGRAVRGADVSAKKKEDKEEEITVSWYLRQDIVAIILILLTILIMPSALPFGVFQFWNSHGTSQDWLNSAYLIFIWGVGATLFFSYATRNPHEQNMAAEKLMVVDALVSLWAGVMEEISFRWLLFLGAIITVQISNFFLGGFLGLFGMPGWGLVELFQWYIVGTVADFFTFGYLAEIFNNRSSWAIGAGLLAANAWFRDGHKYQGALGILNSWFLGMFMFWFMFKFGLPATIAVHFAYDFLIGVVRYIDRSLERAQYLRRRDK